MQKIAHQKSRYCFGTKFTIRKGSCKLFLTMKFLTKILPRISEVKATGQRYLGGISDTASNSMYNIGTAAVSTAGKSALFFGGPIFLDPSLFGIYAYYFWIASVAISLGSAGTVLAVQRLTSRYYPSGLQPALLRFICILTLFLTCGALIFLLALPRTVSSEPRVLACTVVFGIFGAFVAVQQAESQAHHNFRLPFIGETFGQSLRLGVLWLLKLLSTLVPWSFLLLDGIVSLAKSLVLFSRPNAFTQICDKRRADLDNSEKLTILRTCVLPVTAIAVLDTILWQRGEIFFLGIYSGAAATAYFSSAAQIGQLFVLAPTAALSSLIPKMAEKSLGGQESFNGALNRLLNLAILFTIPLYCVGVALGPLIVHFWKPQYGTVSNILPLIMLGRMSLLVSAPVSLALYASGHERTVLKISASSATFALLIDFLLISHFQLLGAAVATALNQMVTAVITLMVGSRFLEYRVQIKKETFGLLLAIAIVQLAFAGSTARIGIAFVGLLISTFILYKEPFLAEEIFPAFSQKLGSS